MLTGICLSHEVRNVFRAGFVAANSSQRFFVPEAQHFPDEGNWSPPEDKPLLARIATNYLLLLDCTISKHEF